MEELGERKIYGIKEKGGGKERAWGEEEEEEAEEGEGEGGGWKKRKKTFTFPFTTHQSRPSPPSTSQNSYISFKTPSIPNVSGACLILLGFF